MAGRGALSKETIRKPQRQMNGQPSASAADRGDGLGLAEIAAGGRQGALSARGGSRSGHNFSDRVASVDSAAQDAAFGLTDWVGGEAKRLKDNWVGLKDIGAGIGKQTSLEDALASLGTGPARVGQGWTRPDLNTQREGLGQIGSGVMDATMVMPFVGPAAEGAGRAVGALSRRVGDPNTLGMGAVFRDLNRMGETRPLIQDAGTNDVARILNEQRRAGDPLSVRWLKGPDGKLYAFDGAKFTHDDVIQELGWGKDSVLGGIEKGEVASTDEFAPIAKSARQARSGEAAQLGENARQNRSAPDSQADLTSKPENGPGALTDYRRPSERLGPDLPPPEAKLPEDAYWNEVNAARQATRADRTATPEPGALRRHVAQTRAETDLWSPKPISDPFLTPEQIEFVAKYKSTANKAPQSQAFKDGGFKSQGAFSRALGRVSAEGDVRAPHVNRGRTSIDNDRIAKEARAIFEASGGVPRDYAKQIADKTGINVNSVRRGLFSMRMEKDPRVADIPDWGADSLPIGVPNKGTTLGAGGVFDDDNPISQAVGRFVEKFKRGALSKAEPTTNPQYGVRDRLGEVRNALDSQAEFERGARSAGPQREGRGSLSRRGANQMQAQAETPSGFVPPTSLDDLAGDAYGTKTRANEPDWSVNKTPSVGDNFDFAAPTAAERMAAADEARQTAAGGLADIERSWESAGIKSSVTENKGTISVGKIVVPEGRRGQGLGTKAMQELADYADKTGQRIVLSPSTDFGGSSKSRLTDFYKRFGFKENAGRSKDFSTRETMFREPAAKPPTRTMGALSVAPDKNTLGAGGVFRKEPRTSNGTMVKQTEWSAEEDALVRKLHAQGLSDPEVAAQLPGRTRGMVRSYRNLRGINRTAPSALRVPGGDKNTVGAGGVFRRPSPESGLTPGGNEGRVKRMVDDWTPEQLRIVDRALERGRTPAQIAQMTGKSREDVAKAIEELTGSRGGYPDHIEQAAQDIEASGRRTGGSLADYVTKHGGIKDDRGDVAQIIDKGRVGALNKKGRSLDDMALAAWEDGYFPGHTERPTTREFLDALDEDMRKGPRAAPEDQHVTDMLEHYDRAGINTSLRGDALREALMRAGDGGTTLGAGPMFGRKPTASTEPPLFTKTKSWTEQNMPTLSDDGPGMRAEFERRIKEAGLSADETNLARAYYQQRLETMRDQNWKPGASKGESETAQAFRRVAETGDADARRAAAAGVRAAEAETRPRAGALTKPAKTAKQERDDYFSHDADALNAILGYGTAGAYATGAALGAHELAKARKPIMQRRAN